MEHPDTSALFNLLKEEPLLSRTQEIYELIRIEVQETFISRVHWGLWETASRVGYLEMSENKKQIYLDAIEKQLIQYLEHLKHYRKGI